ncbi:MAG TPA: DUF6343 family protein [Kribbella sp.]|nr:DUF6343 family protein [Kribbella sp.]
MNDPSRPDRFLSAAGSAPARSALTLRLVLASFGLVVCGGAAVVYFLLDLPVGTVAVAAALALVAVVDIVVVARRLHRQRRSTRR